jgi:hypothetical protein
MEERTGVHAQVGLQVEALGERLVAGYEWARINGLSVVSGEAERGVFGGVRVSLIQRPRTLLHGLKPSNRAPLRRGEGWSGRERSCDAPVEPRKRSNGAEAAQERSNRAPSRGRGSTGAEPRQHRSGAEAALERSRGSAGAEPRQRRGGAELEPGPWLAESPRGSSARQVQDSLALEGDVGANSSDSSESGASRCPESQ